MTLLSKLKESPLLYLAMLAAWPVLNFWNSNFDWIFSYHELGIIFVVLTILHLIGYAFFKKIFKWNLSAFLVLGLIFYVMRMVLLGYLSTFLTSSFQMKGAQIIMFLCIFLVLTKFKNTLDIKKIGLVFLAVFLSPSLALVEKVLKKEPLDSLDPNLTFVFQKKPNIYFFIVDKYPSEMSFIERKQTNSRFLKSLKNENFALSPYMFSNYHNTGWSIPTTFHMNYFKHMNRLCAVTSKQDRNQVLSILRHNNYHFRLFPSYFSGFGFEANFFGELTLLFINYFLPWFKYSQYITPLTILDHLKKDPIIAPSFTFVHFVEVHDVICRKGLLGKDHLYQKKAHTEIFDFIETFNKEMEILIQHIRKEDPRAIIIIQSDHGGFNEPASDPKSLEHHPFQKKDIVDFIDMYHCLSAVHYPDNPDVFKYFSGHYTPVNTFRVIFSDLSGTAPQLLDNKSFFMTRQPSPSPYGEDVSDYHQKAIDYIKQNGGDLS